MGRRYVCGWPIRRDTRVRAAVHGPKPRSLKPPVARQRSRLSILLARRRGARGLQAQVVFGSKDTLSILQRWRRNLERTIRCARCVEARAPYFNCEAAWGPLRVGPSN